MTRTGRDSTTPADIPLAGTQLAMGYGNGLYTWTDTDWDRFPGVPHVYIDVNGTDAHRCGVLDVETGDATVATAVTWAEERLKLGHAYPHAYPPVIYCNRATLPALHSAMAAAGLRLGVDFRLWVATLDGTRTLPDMTGVAAVQDKGESLTGGHYDESVVYDDEWHAPPPPPAKALDGYLVLEGGAGGFTGRAVTSADGGKTWS